MRRRCTWQTRAKPAGQRGNVSVLRPLLGRLNPPKQRTILKLLGFPLAVELHGSIRRSRSTNSLSSSLDSPSVIHPSTVCVGRQDRPPCTVDLSEDLLHVHMRLWCATCLVYTVQYCARACAPVQSIQLDNGCAPTCAFAKGHLACSCHTHVTLDFGRQVVITASARREPARTQYVCARLNLKW